VEDGQPGQAQEAQAAGAAPSPARTTSSDHGTLRPSQDGLVERARPWHYLHTNPAGMAELVDAPDLGSGFVRSGGSSPPPRTVAILHKKMGRSDASPWAGSVRWVLSGYYQRLRHEATAGSAFEPCRPCKVRNRLI
jgi:hypothetical protein